MGSRKPLCATWASKFLVSFCKGAPSLDIFDLSNSNMMKFCTILILVVAILMAEAAPRKYYRRRYHSNQRTYGGYSSGPNQGLKNHGATKVATGLGLGALGLITGNQGLQNTGAGLVKLGLASKVAAHFF